jgi:tetratricopeptide (TPR) repeat protein
VPTTWSIQKRKATIFGVMCFSLFSMPPAFAPDRHKRRRGKVYDDLLKEQEALQFYDQALPIHRQVGDHRGEAATRNGMGRVYTTMGKTQEALMYNGQALAVWRDME